MQGNDLCGKGSVLEENDGKAWHGDAALEGAGIDEQDTVAVLNGSHMGVAVEDSVCMGL